MGNKILKLLAKILLYIPKRGCNIDKRYSFYNDILEILLRIMNYGGDFDISSSGEKDALAYVTMKLAESYPHDSLTIFDIGANRGDYSIEVSKLMHQEHQIFAFEPMVSTYQQLLKNISSSTDIVPYNIGMSDQSGKRTIFADKEGSTLTSLYKRRLDHFNIDFGIQHECDFTTVDEYCEEKGIKRIHFLKIDTEGHELSVLLGAKKMIESGNIDYIQFEFGGCDIDSRTFFQDFWYHLNDKYRIYRIVQGGLFPLITYNERMEIFIYSNYIAEKR